MARKLFKRRTTKDFKTVAKPPTPPPANLRSERSESDSTQQASSDDRPEIGATLKWSIPLRQKSPGFVYKKVNCKMHLVL